MSLSLSLNPNPPWEHRVGLGLANPNDKQSVSTCLSFIFNRQLLPLFLFTAGIASRFTFLRGLLKLCITLGHHLSSPDGGVTPSLVCR